ncbi:MAG: hypothetical protein MJ252_06545, partial [archaeon]|nr:hypothetical protein [archaeon]
MPAREPSSSGPKDPQKEELESLADAIQTAWLRDVAKVEEMQRVDIILREIISLDRIESYFTQEDTFQYFMNGFSETVISKILAQSTVYGENGEVSAFQILKDYCDIFIKFHSNPSYLKLWEKIKEIFEPTKQFYTYSPQLTRINNSLKAVSATEFNSIFLKMKYEPSEVELERDKEIEILVHTKEVYGFWTWVRGIICNVFEEHISVRTPVTDSPSIIKKDSYEYAKVGTHTKDWEWRCNLQEGDIIDCFERGTYYPGTIMSRKEEISHGIPKITYRVSYRIYEDSVEDISKYQIFWKDNKILQDQNERRYIGDPETFDDTIGMFSERLNKRDSKIWNAKGKKFSMSSDTNYKLDELFDTVDREGKKTITIGRNNTYSYFYNSLINYLGQLGFFEIIIDNLTKFNSPDKPIPNEVLMIGLNLLSNCVDYLYSPYAKEIASLLKDKVFSYLDVLSNSDLRNLKKELIDLIADTLKKYLSVLFRDSEKEDDIFEKFQIAFSMKLLKTDFLEKRNSAIKGIIDLIRSSHFEKEKQKEILNLIKNNKVIYEIFGPNSHVQLISKSKELIQILIEYDELEEEDLNLIWSCTKNGDLESKLAILKILKELSYSLKPNYVKMLLESMTKDISKEEMGEDELSLNFELIGKLVEFDENSPIISKCIDNYINNLINLDYTEKDKIQKLIEKIISLCTQHDKIMYIVLKKAIYLIQSKTDFVIGFKLIYSFKENFREPITEEFRDLFLKDDFIINIYKKCFIDYTTEAKEKLKDLPKNENEYNNTTEKILNIHLRSMHTLLEFLLGLINYEVWSDEDELLVPDGTEQKETPIEFVYNNLYTKNITYRDKSLFYNWSKTLLNIPACIKKIYEIFTTKICSSQESIEELNNLGFDLFWEMFLKLNTSIEVKEYGIISKTPAQELQGFNLLWKIIFESKDRYIMMHGIHLLSCLFRTFSEDGTETSEGLQKLIGLCINELKKNNTNVIMKSIVMLNRIIEESEKFGTANIVSHIGLQKRTMHIINVNPLSLSNCSEFTLNLPSNTTIYQLKKEISSKLNYHFDFLKIDLKNFNKDNTDKEEHTIINDFFCLNKEKETIILDYEFNGKTFYDLRFPQEVFITVIPNGFERNIPSKEILVNGVPTEEIIKIFGEWFDKYSENGKMTPTLCGQFVKEVTNSAADIGPNDSRVTELFRERDANNDGLLEKEEFVEFYSDSTKAKPHLVYENAKCMGYRNDLKKMNEGYFPENTDKSTMPRYQLAIKEDFFSSIFNSFSPIKENINEEEKEKIERMNMYIFQLINQLVTNPKIYDNILNCKGDNWGEIFHDDNIYKMVYCLEIIEAVMETVIKGDSDKLEIFQEWTKTFITKNGYDYLIKIFLKLLGEMENKKSRIIMIAINALIRNIKIFCINSHESFIEPKLHSFLVKEDLCNKINDTIKAFDIISNLLKILNNFINTNEYEITNEIFELLSIIIPTVNLPESFDYKLLLNIIKEGILNENVFIRDKFYSVIIRMDTLLIEQHKFDIIEKIMNHILDCIKTLDKNKGEISRNLFDIFTVLLEDYLKYKDNFKEAKFNDPEYYKNIISIIKDGLDKKLRISDEIFIGYIKIISKITKINSEIKEYISKDTSLVDDILKGILFKDNIKTNEDNKLFIKIEDDNSKTHSKKSKGIKRKVCYEFILSMFDNSIENIINFFKMDLLSSKEDEENKSNKENKIYSENQINNIFPQRPAKYSQNYSSSSYSYDYYKRKSEERKKEGYVGLKNLGCICYMNSSLQQFFMVPSLRYGILRFDDGEPENISYVQNGIDDNMFHQVQKLFSYLLMSERMDYNPFGFTYAFKDFEGQPTKLTEQKDAQEFLSIFFDRIESASKKTKYKYLIQNIFGGKNCSQIKCLDCNKISNRFED